MKFDEIVVRRFNPYTHEILEKTYKNCSLKRAVAWFNKFDFEGFGFAYVHMVNGHKYIGIYTD